jgi:hypothetical protein
LSELINNQSSNHTHTHIHIHTFIHTLTHTLTHILAHTHNTYLHTIKSHLVKVIDIVVLLIGLASVDAVPVHILGRVGVHCEKKRGELVGGWQKKKKKKAERGRVVRPGTHFPLKNAEK